MTDNVIQQQTSSPLNNYIIVLHNLVQTVTGYYIMHCVHTMAPSNQKGYEWTKIFMAIDLMK